jgi:hypothetical protein
MSCGDRIAPPVGSNSLRDEARAPWKLNRAFDRTSPATGTVRAGGGTVETNSEQELQNGNGTRTSQASISAALAAANTGLPSTLGSPVRFPGEDGGRSLAEMAENNLDAALQLLAVRAQYITGANGAAIALRRSGKNDMQCRASTGANVPELGALLSTEFGLSGESVRTRKALRCDDAERDPRVNREGCRELGIASVVVMPVVNDDEVLGVFELFSGKVNAFGERDLSALQRLSEMVETAVRLARAAENIPERWMAADVPVAGSAAQAVLDDQILEVEDPVVEVEAEQFAEGLGLSRAEAPTAEAPTAEAPTEEKSSIAALEAPRHPTADSAAKAEITANREAVLEPSTASSAQAAAALKISATIAASAPPAAPTVVARSVVSASSVSSSVSSIIGSPSLPPIVVAPRVAALPEEPAPSVQTTLPTKPLFWSAALSPAADAEKPAEDQSNVPPGLRNLRTCEACGFPVSPGRALCVECEEKRWRGQLKRPAAARPESPGSGSPSAPLLAKSARNGASAVAAPSTPVSRLVAAAAAQSASAPLAPARENPAAPPATPDLALPEAQTSRPVVRGNEAKAVAGPPLAVASNPAVGGTAAPKTSEVPSPAFVLSAGLEPSQSWLSANKYIIGALLVAATAAAIFLLR